MSKLSGCNRISASAFLVATVCWCVGAYAQALVHFDLPAQPLARSLQAIGTATNTDVGFSATQVAGLLAPALKADLTVDGALTRVLVGTGLRPKHLDDHTIVIAAAASFTSDSSETEPSRAEGLTPTEATTAPLHISNLANGSSDLRSTHADGPFAQDGANSAAREDNDKDSSLEEILVTGTLIRGTVPASPVITIDRQDIERSGLQNLGDVIRSLPQSFSGGQNPGNLGASGSQNTYSFTGASTANLRGLGSDSTLSLVDGHRLAYDGSGSSVDISLIPLAAVERIEVVTDGASAQYGSDAVAGVVNIILRPSYDGITISTTQGLATRGGGETQQYDMLAGTKWASGNVMLTYEYADQDSILGSDRNFVAAAEPTTLLPDTRQQSALLKGRQSLTDTISVFAEGLYAHRLLDSQQATIPALTSHTSVDQYGAVAGVNLSLPYSWNGSLSVNSSESRDASTEYQLSPASTSYNTYANYLTAGDVEASGPVLDLPSGAVSAAVGGGYRREKFSYLAMPTAGIPAEYASRRAEYAFSELRIPLVTPSSARTGLNDLQLSVSGRFEDYSDFGSTVDPKLGILYSPSASLKTHATWGTSFHAPSLLQQYAPYQAYLFSIPDPLSTSSTSTAMVTLGGNRNLQPEKSKSWTLGIDFTPTGLPGFKTSIDYFHISYRDRIGIPISNFFNALTDPVYAGFVTRDPSALIQAAAIAGSSSFSNFSGAPYDPTTVAALVNVQNANFTRQDASGADVMLDYTWESLVGRIDTSLNATILSLKEQLLAASPDMTISGTVFNPPKGRLRGGLTWSRGILSFSGYVNYTGTSESTEPSAHIASWTTVDAVFSLRMPETGPLSGFRLNLAAQNITDRDPPFVASAITAAVPGLHYDSTNASAVGRFVSLQLLKAF
jgi:iron complex outermembrane receptor protein